MLERYEVVKEWRRRTKARAVEAMGGKCACCGYSECLKAMDFHHLNPKDKEFNLTNNIKSWSKIVSELRKCVLVCCRCHAEIHDGVKMVPKNAPRFNESFSEYRPIKQFEPCPVCGNPKSMTARTCSKRCFGMIRQKIDWSKVNLLDESKISSPEQIGIRLGVSGNTIRKRLKILLVTSKGSSTSERRP